jgi:Holliday junction resolvase RusA-like endonuclease
MMNQTKLFLTIEDETLPSWNTLYSGKHWAVRKHMADYWHDLVTAYLMKNWRNKGVIKGSVKIQIICYFKSHRWIDSDNLCGKLIIDALKGVVIKDDSPKYVKEVCCSSRMDAKHPRTEIYVY